MDSLDGPSPQLCFSRRRFLTLGGLTLVATVLVPWRSVLAASTGGGALIPPRKPRAPRLLMIDPGHGGHDPGAIGIGGVQEKDITLDIAQRIADSLIPETGVDVKLTRERDIFLPLQERVRLAQASRADLLVSIHADSAPSKTARGLSIYTLSEKASDQLADALATRENNADMMGGIDLGVADREVAAILFDLTARRTRNTSQRTKFTLIKALGRRWPLLENPMRAANFAVLRAPEVPSVLVETGFLSNPQDERLLTNPKHRARIAKLLAKEMAQLLQGPLFG